MPARTALRRTERSSVWDLAAGRQRKLGSDEIDIELRQRVAVDFIDRHAAETRHEQHVDSVRVARAC
jgi:hypothetical protein